MTFLNDYATANKCPPFESFKSLAQRHLNSSDKTKFKSIFEEAFLGHVPEDTTFLFFKWLLNGIDMMQLCDEEAKEKAIMTSAETEYAFDVNVLRMRTISTNERTETPSLLSTKSFSTDERSSHSYSQSSKDLVDRILDAAAGTEELDIMEERTSPIKSSKVLVDRILVQKSKPASIDSRCASINVSKDADKLR